MCNLTTKNMFIVYLEGSVVVDVSDLDSLVRFRSTRYGVKIDVKNIF